METVNKCFYCLMENNNVESLNNYKGEVTNKTMCENHNAKVQAIIATRINTVLEARKAGKISLDEANFQLNKPLSINLGDMVDKTKVNMLFERK